MLIRLLTFIALFLSASFIAGLQAQPASACSCVNFNAKEAFQRADAVLIGQVEQVRSSDNAVQYKVAVEKSYKAVTPRTVIVETSAQGASCGASFTVDQKYIMYVTGKELYSTTLCSGNQIFDEQKFLSTYGQAYVPSLDEQEFSNGGEKSLPILLLSVTILAATLVTLLYREKRKAHA